VPKSARICAGLGLRSVNSCVTGVVINSKISWALASGPNFFSTRHSSCLDCASSLKHLASDSSISTSTSGKEAGCY
jgi:hypothetical protein